MKTLTLVRPLLLPSPALAQFIPVAQLKLETIKRLRTTQKTATTPLEATDSAPMATRATSRAIRQWTTRRRRRGRVEVRRLFSSPLLST
jgi:hypothetical protein